ncbi:MAG: peptide chain release factor 1 [Nitrospirae bacterium]|nr:peptide chain release factor 1 [Nitrospirota bacterium]
MFERLDAILARYEELCRLLSDPKVLASPGEYPRYSKEQADLSEAAERYRTFLGVVRQIAETEEILRDPRTDPELRDLAEGEFRALQARREVLQEELRQLLLPKDPHDAKNTLLEIRAGAGGEEAALFVAELFRMYCRYAERHGWRVEMISSNPTGIGGLKEVIALLEGRGAYSRLKYEKGVHRVQRVPVTEAGGRIHTSAVTVAILPEAEEVEVQIDPKELRIDTFCSSGPGGQSVNTTYSAVRVTHLPTGLVVSCQDEKSQIKNKAKAMKVLRARLLEIRQAALQAERSLERRTQVGTGDRSERIRTYNFPQNRVTDHRIGMTLHRLEGILDGDLDSIIDALAVSQTEEQLKAVKVGT